MDTPTTPPIDLSGVQVKTPPAITKETLVQEVESKVEAAYAQLKREASLLLAHLRDAFGALEKAGHPAVHPAKAQAEVVRSLIKAPEPEPAGSPAATPPVGGWPTVEAPANPALASAPASTPSTSTPPSPSSETPAQTAP